MIPRHDLPALALALALLVAASPADAQRRSDRQRDDGTSIGVEVTEIAGGRAFLSAGEDQGVRIGSVVTIRTSRLRVVAATRTTSVVTLGDAPVREGDRGRATIVPEAEALGRRLPTPAPLARHRGTWPRAVRPATLQHPRHVSIGRIAPTGPIQVVLSEASAAAVPFAAPSDAVAWTELRARARGAATTSLGFDADAAVRLWLARGLLRQAGQDRRPTVLVRAAELQLGSTVAPILALGRLRSAAATVGMLDGVRVRSPSLGGLSFAAFGGAVPDPETTEPALGAARFGVEVTARDPSSALSPSLSLVGLGSTFQGELDERRVSLLAHVFPGPASLGGSLELSQFPADNPWGAPGVELTAASLDAGLRLGSFRAGARFDLWRPERSLWLDEVLPDGLFCRHAPTTRECDWPGEAIVSGALDVGLDGARTVLRAGGSVATGAATRKLEELAGFVFARQTGLAGFGRLELGATGTRTTFADVFAVRPGVGVGLLEGTLDLGLYGRPTFFRSFLDGAWRIDHRFGMELAAAPAPWVDVTVTAEVSTGYDRDALLVMSTAAFRPLQ